MTIVVDSWYEVFLPMFGVHYSQTSPLHKDVVQDALKKPYLFSLLDRTIMYC